MEVFTQTELLHNMANKDLATPAFQDALASALPKGQDELEHSVVERFIEKSEKFHRPIKQNNPMTFTNLYKVEKKRKAKGETVVLKADINVIQLHLLLEEL